MIHYQLISHNISTTIFFSVFQSDFDLAYPPASHERKLHKLKKLVQAPHSFFMDVRCNSCMSLTTVFSHATSQGMFQMTIIGILIPIMLYNEVILVYHYIFHLFPVYPLQYSSIHTFIHIYIIITYIIIVSPLLLNLFIFIYIIIHIQLFVRVVVLFLEHPLVVSLSLHLVLHSVSRSKLITQY